MSHSHSQLRVDGKKLTTSMKKSKVLGVSIAYIDDKGSISTKQLGVTDKSGSHKVKPETIFGVASLSKPVFTYLVLKLAQHNIVDLDKPLSEVLSFKKFCEENNFPWQERKSDSARLSLLTARMALSHTTGLDSNEAQFLFDPGSEYGYSNLGLLYLQKVIEKQTKLTLETLAQQYVFGPKALNMPHSTFYQKYDLEPMSNALPVPRKMYLESSRRGLKYKVIGLDGNLKNKTIPWSALPKNFPRKTVDIIKSQKEFLPLLLRYTSSVGHTTGPAAVAVNSLFTTPEDYAKLVNAWMHDEDKTMQAAFNPAIFMTTDKWAKAMGVPEKDLEKVAWGLGFGLQTNDKNKANRAYHSGDMNDWRAWVAMDLENKTAIVYFANSKNGHILAEQIISPHVELQHGFGYFFPKYGFARKLEADWENLEAIRWNSIGKHLDDVNMTLSDFGQASNTAKAFAESSTAKLMRNVLKQTPPSKSKHQKLESDPLLEDMIKDAKIPGISVSVVTQDGVVQSAIAGVTDEKSRQPIVKDTFFEAASLSKPVFAYIVLKMIERGEFSAPGESPESGLDRPLHEICDFGPPHLRNHPNYKKLTPRLLLSHQAGLPNWFKPEEPEKYVSTSGESFDYSGLAYCFLNEVIETKTGKKLEEIARKEFKNEKLQMNNSTFLAPPEFRAIGHYSSGLVDRREHFPSNHGANPAASLFTTSEDYAKFLRACAQDEFIRKYMFDPQVKLANKDKKAIDAGVSPEALNHLSWGMGMGLQTAEDGSTIAFHWGDVETCRSFAAINLNTNQSVSCFTNSANGSRVFQQIAEPIVGSLGAIPEWLSRREKLDVVVEQAESKKEEWRSIFSLPDPRNIPKLVK